MLARCLGCSLHSNLRHVEIVLQLRGSQNVTTQLRGIITSASASDIRVPVEDTGESTKRAVRRHGAFSCLKSLILSRIRSRTPQTSIDLRQLSGIMAFRVSARESPPPIVPGKAIDARKRTVNYLREWPVLLSDIQSYDEHRNISTEASRTARDG